MIQLSLGQCIDSTLTSYTVFLAAFFSFMRKIKFFSDSFFYQSCNFPLLQNILFSPFSLIFLFFITDFAYADANKLGYPA